MTATNPEIAAVERALADWVKAVQNGEDLRRFMAHDFTGFVPPTQRLAPGAAPAPNANFVPEEITIRVDGRLAVVTFQYHDPPTFNRRTFIYRRTDGGWKVMHLHGDNLPLP